MQDMLGQWWQKACERNQPVSDFTERPFLLQDGSHTQHCLGDQEPETR